MTRLIKRYANRKLYDTKAKRYLTLDDVAELIQRGESIRVMDNETGQDVTNVVLSSIILERAKRDESILSDALLIEMIQKRGEAVVEAVKKSVAAGMGAAEMIQQEIEKRLKEAMEKGREQADSAAAIAESLGFMLKELVTQTQKTVEQTIEKNLTRLLASMNIPTRQEVAELEAQVERLTQRVEALTTPRRTTKKKSVARAAKKTSVKSKKTTKSKSASVRTKKK